MERGGRGTRPGVAGILAGAARDRPRRIGSLEQSRQQHLVGVGKAGFFTADGAHADALLDAVRALFDNAVLERPGFLARQLEVQIRIVHAAAHERVEYLAQAPLIESRGRQDHFLGHGKGRLNKLGAGRVHVKTAAAELLPSWRLSNAGKRARDSAWLARSMSAVITPVPFAKRDNT